jgi:hypothetical protein
MSPQAGRHEQAKKGEELTIAIANGATIDRMHHHLTAGVLAGQAFGGDKRRLCICIARHVAEVPWKF